MTKATEVVVAVLFDEKGRFLMSSRPEGKVYSGYWEFPGGKVEKGETLEMALKREMLEELNLTVDHCREVHSLVYTYPHDTVHLHFIQCEAAGQTPECKESQTYRFFTLENLPEPILPATLPVLQRVISR